jgi:hypothetical protein
LFNSSLILSTASTPVSPTSTYDTQSHSLTTASISTSPSGPELSFTEPHQQSHVDGQEDTQQPSSDLLSHTTGKEAMKVSKLR